MKMEFVICFFTLSIKNVNVIHVRGDLNYVNLVGKQKIKF